MSKRSNGQWGELGRRASVYLGLRGSRYGRVDPTLDEDLDELRREVAMLRRRVDELEGGDSLDEL